MDLEMKMFKHHQQSCTIQFIQKKYLINYQRETELGKCHHLIDYVVFGYAFCLLGSYLLSCPHLYEL